MSNIHEEIQESEFFIIRKGFMYQINKMQFDQFYNTIFGQNRGRMHNFFIIEHIKKCITINDSKFIAQINYKNKFKKPIFKKKKVNNRKLILCLKNCLDKKKYIIEKKNQNLKIINIRYELEWKIELRELYFFLICIFNKYKLFFKLIEVILFLKKYTKMNLTRKIICIILGTVENIYFFF